MPDSGTVLIEGEDVTNRPARTRGVGMVFQHYAAFKHMTVAKNVAFGLDVRKRPKADTRAKVAELLELVGLAHLGERYPSQLSGGQRQRMALARALAVEPRVLLLDEPFGALDARVREELRRWLRRLHDDVHVTTIFVTHDQEEAMEISEQIVVVNEGRIEQSATPGEIYDNPASPFVMGFVGPVTRVGGEMVRPHDVQVLTEPGEASQQAVVTRIWWLGFEVRAELLPAEGDLLVAQMSRAEADALELGEGQIVHVRVDPTRARPEPASA
jgi:sulfate transport system ATP-binding protein